MHFLCRIIWYVISNDGSEVSEHGKEQVCFYILHIGGADFVNLQIGLAKW